MREEMNKYLEMLGEDEEAQNKLRDFNNCANSVNKLAQLLLKSLLYRLQ